MPHHNRPPPAVRPHQIGCGYDAHHFHYRHDKGGFEICQPGNSFIFPHAIHRALGPLPVSLAYAYMIYGIGNSSTGARDPVIIYYPCRG